MATVTQRLAFLISANADSAIKAFEKTSGSAAKEMAKAEKSLEKAGANLTKFGAAGLAAAGTLGGGLFKLAQGAIEDQKAQALLAEQLRNSTGATQKQIDAVEKLIDKTARATGVADDQLRPALGNLVRAFGDTDKATTVLSTALDISAATGRDLETVTIALGRAASGNVGALSRLGIPLDENVKKSKDFNAALQALNEQFGGAAAARAETYAGKLDRAKVAISEAGESIGTAFIPVVEKSATAIAGTVNKLGEINNATGGAIGKFAAFGTVGLGVVSTLSLVAGQAIKLRDRFTTLGDDGERSMTKLGNAAKYASLTLAAIGLSEATFAVLNEMNNSSQKLEQGLQDLNVALSQVDASAMLRQFRELVKDQDSVLRFSNIWGDFGKRITIVGGEADRSIEDIDRAFQQVLKESGPKAAQSLLDAWSAQNSTLDQASGQYKDNTMLIERYQSRIDSLTGSQKALNQINAEASVGLVELKKTYEDYSRALIRNEDRQQQLTIEKAVNAERERQSAADQKAAEAAAKFKAEVETLAQALQTKLAKALSDAEQNAEKANTAYKTYRDTISGSVSGVVNLGNAQATAAENTKKLADARTEEGRAQGKLNELLGKQVDIDDKVAAAREKLIAAQQRPDSDKEKADAIKDAERDLNRLLEDQTGIVKQVTDARTDLATATNAVLTAEKQPLTFADALAGQVTKAEGFKTNLQKVLDLGGDQALIDQLTAAGADAGNSIITGILASSDPAQTVDDLDKTLANVAAFASAIGTISADKFFGAGVKLADDLLRGVTEELSKIDVDKLAESKNPLKALRRASNKFDSSLGFLFSENALTIPSLADGGIVPARPGGTLVRVGEAGQDEMVLPLPRQQSGSNITINVTAGMGADGAQIGRQIVDELVAYQRRVGALPIKVSG
jgi:hypothetical protein